MKILKIFSENMEQMDAISNWRYVFRKGAWIFLVMLILSLVGNIMLGSRYLEFKKDNGEIISCISTESGMTPSYNLETIIGKYHISPNRKLSDSTVYDILVECGAWYPEVIMAQYVMESGSGTSTLARHSHNLFGMRVAQRRPTTQLSGVSNSGYGSYLNREHSIIDRVLWERWIFKNEKPSYEVYLSKIGSIYAEAPDYREKLESVARKYKR